MKKIISFLTITLLGLATGAHAHSIWINSFESHVHQPPHTMVSLGWGHTLPMDDILTSPNSRIAIERFDIYNPSLTPTGLVKPEFKISKADLSTENVEVFAADLGVQKVSVKKNSMPGVYQFSAVSKPGFYTKYIDKNGKSRMKLKPKDQLDDIQTVTASVKFQAFAKAYMTLGKWTPPNALGHGLEIIPRTDLSDLSAGDLVEVDVMFYGKPLSTSKKGIKYITAQSSSFGQQDGFYLMSYIKKGRAQLRVQGPGQWMIAVKNIESVTADGSLQELYGKVDQVYHSASLTFQVR